jgi:G3E family GTPase
MNFQRDPLASKIPVTIITGFLGSGKTTLISELVRHPEMNRVALVINEVGEIGIDHDLVESSTENISLLSNGCICCSLRTDMQETLRDLFAKRSVGEVFDFDRVIIETTGLADPAPVLQTLVSDTLLEAQFRFDGLVTLVDVVNFPIMVQTQKEIVKQIAIADKLFLTKSDLIDSSEMEMIQNQIRELNNSAQMIVVTQGKVSPLELMNLGLSSTKSSSKILSFLGEQTESGKYLGQFVQAHDSGIQTLSLRFTDPFTWEAFSSALDLLSNLRGPDLLRMKGIINVSGQPVVVQGVQHIFHPPVHLKDWPSADHDSRMVFITRHIEAQLIRNLFDTVRLLNH